MFFECFCRFFKKIVCLVGIAVTVWLIVSWVDVLLHNDPVYGDKQYMPSNAIVMMLDLTE